MSPVLRVGLVLASVAVLGTALVTGTRLLTGPAIRANRADVRLDRLHELIPENTYDNRPLQDTIRIRAPSRLGTNERVTVYRARRAGEPVAVAFRVVAPDGYNGPIHVLVAIGSDGELLGARVLDHRETPGLGSGISTSESDWIRQFAGHSLGSPPAEGWRVRKDGGVFDALTGATITSRAVIGALRRALELFRHRKEDLFRREEGSGSRREGKEPE